MRESRHASTHLRTHLRRDHVASVATIALVALLSPTPASAQDLGSLTLRKANLDLPLSAAGDSAENELDPPEILVFYGSAYEANAVVFALDKSGSMDEQNRWKLQSQEVSRSISELSDTADFGVVYYGSRVHSFRERPLSATAGSKSAALGFLSATAPGGDTCIAEGVVKALEIVRRSEHEHKAVIVTSDGRPDVCATGNLATPAQMEQLYQKTLAANPGKNVRVHTIWVGTGNDRLAIDFLKRLAEIHGGSFRRISG